MAWGAAIRRRRKALKVSVISAAGSAAISRITWHRIENGEAGVSAGAYAKALAVLGLTCSIELLHEEGPRQVGDRTPRRIALDDYPQLRRLAWHIRDGAYLTEQEAFELYERNKRHYSLQQLSEEERLLETALRRKFGEHGTKVSK
jgi:transcriptional regulator with XRE-family HTH domain